LHYSGIVPVYFLSRGIPDLSREAGRSAETLVEILNPFSMEIAVEYNVPFALLHRVFLPAHSVCCIAQETLRNGDFIL